MQYCNNIHISIEGAYLDGFNDFNFYNRFVGCR